MNKNQSSHVPVDYALEKLTQQDVRNPELRYIAKESFLQIERGNLLFLVMSLAGPSSGKYSPDTSVDALLDKYSPDQMAAVLKIYLQHAGPDYCIGSERTSRLVRPLAELRESWQKSAE